MGLFHVFYHYPCPDGIFSALSVDLFAKQQKREGKTVEIVWHPMKVFLKPEDQVTVCSLKLGKDDECYFMDYTGNAGFVSEICKSKCKKVVVLDHHKTAQEDIGKLQTVHKFENLEIVFDMNRCGAKISYDYFNERAGGCLIQSSEAELKAKLDGLFAFIQDADLWTWKLENSKEFSAGFNAREMEFDCRKNAEIFDTLISLDAKKLIAEGVEVIKETNAIIKKELKSSFVIDIGGDVKSGKFMAVITKYGGFRSQMGNELAQKSLKEGYRGIGAIVCEEEELQKDKKMYKVSMRSLKEPVNEDTSVISKHFGGGGHANASSFNIEAEQFDSWRVEAKRRKISS
eukprot:Nk52_evm26s628 gene=Nk52_evmTU26s628